MIADADIKLPRRATTGSAGYDIFAPYDLDIQAGEWLDIDCGVRFEKGDIPEGFFFMMVPKSGLGFKYGVRLANTVGIIDSDYDLNIHAKVTADTYVHIPKGKAFMQGIIVPYGIMRNEAEPTEIRKGGFGSTNS